jgi:hypothetical protein
LVGVGLPGRIDALEEDEWEREVLEEVEKGSGISRSNAGMEMEGRIWGCSGLE